MNLDEVLKERLHTEFNNEELPDWMKFFLNLGRVLSKTKQEKLLIGVAVPRADFCSLLIAAGANLESLESRGRFNEKTNEEISFHGLKAGQFYKVYLDKNKKWEDMPFKRFYDDDENRTIAHFFKTKGGTKEALVYEESFQQKIKDAKYAPSQLEVPDFLRAIFPTLDLTWYLNESLSSSTISNTSIYGVKSHILEDTRNRIFFRNENNSLISGVLADLCKIVINQNRSFGTFTRVISAQRSDQLNKMNKNIDSKIKIFSESAYSKLNADKQREEARIVIFDKSKRYEVLNNARDKFIQESKAFNAIRALDFIDMIPDSITLSVHKISL